ncbi:hypothetical protein AB0K49_13230 [Streptomyces decoyicus]|uniref:hypothetical protein n=1 Tax=Streptomyces decoyicus TaxID=249567 RepID=UPI00345DBC02
MSRLRAVLPKPKSITPAAQREVEQTTPVDTLSRELFADPDAALDYFETRAAGEPLVLLDVGGCFAPALTDLHARFSGQILGGVEDTENGHRRYEDLDAGRCPPTPKPFYAPAGHMSSPRGDSRACNAGCRSS